MITTGWPSGIPDWCPNRRRRPLAALGRQGGLVLPHDHGTDGMAVFRYRMAA